MKCLRIMPRVRLVHGVTSEALVERQLARGAELLELGLRVDVRPPERPAAPAAARGRSVPKRKAPGARKRKA